MNMSVPSGYFNRIDTVHVHVDGGGESEPVENIVNQLREQGSQGKTTPITHFVDGPQRRQAWASTTYESHTPGSTRRESLEYFSTSLLASDLQDMQTASQRLSGILTMLFEQQASLPPGIVVEAERVIAQGEEQIVWSKGTDYESLFIHSPDVGFERSRTADIEIHYAFDIPKTGKWQQTAPIQLEELRNECSRMGIYVGGWFFFQKGNKWAYRSNQFAREPAKREVQEQRDKLNEYLSRKGRELGFECRVRALIEQVLGVWRTPLRKVDQELTKSPSQLAQWEASRDTREFWVIAPNFLGDRRKDVYEAMIKNLRKRVNYTYFLRSFADVQRLRKLTETLEPDIEGYANIFNLMKAVVLESQGFDNSFFEDEYFIAFYNQNDREGYRLLRRRGRVYAGERMSAHDFEKADLLRNLLQQSQVKHWMQIPLRRDAERSRQKAVVSIHVSKLSPMDLEHSEFEPEALRNEFDQIIADNVSKLSGEVVKGSSSSYFIVFDTAEAALTCAAQVQNSVRECNKPLLKSFDLVPPRISVDFGLVSRVLRSYGFDFSGPPVGISDKLLTQVNDGDIVLTKNVEDNLANRQQFKITNPTTLPAEEFGSVECRMLDWE